MQSDKDVSERSQGQLHASLPPGGIPLADGTWVEEGSLIQLNAAVYGLVNAPSAWRKTIVRGIESLGYRRSCYDPCIFCLMDESGPQGHILIEVDDLATHGNAVHAENIAKLQKTFKFVKWKSTYNSEVTMLVELSFKTSLTASTSIRPSLFRKDCPRYQEDVAQTRNPRPLMVKRDSCVRCGAQSIGSIERVALTCRHWHHLAWDHSITVPCKTCVMRMWQLSD